MNSICINMEEYFPLEEVRVVDIAKYLDRGVRLENIIEIERWFYKAYYKTVMYAAEDKLKCLMCG